MHELARRGDLPARRVGRRWLFLRDRLAAAITPLDDPAAWRPVTALKRPVRYSTALLPESENTVANGLKLQESAWLQGLL